MMQKQIITGITCPNCGGVLEHVARSAVCVCGYRRAIKRAAAGGWTWASKPGPNNKARKTWHVQGTALETLRAHFAARGIRPQDVIEAGIAALLIKYPLEISNCL